ncbi:MAG: hypothetical protein Q8J96_10510 [Rhodocyclaceae bacterium]|jgi:hypothetical protein|nr:hypothetical protein [Rhodocyclaceae bacterium]MDP3033443.1 hypothetical protein [Rhodocyclaceae bacterium]
MHVLRSVSRSLAAGPPQGKAVGRRTAEGWFRAAECDFVAHKAARGASRNPLPSVSGGAP